VAVNGKVYELDYLSKSVQLNVRRGSMETPAKQRLESFEEINQQDLENAEGSILDKCAKKSDKVILEQRKLSRGHVSNRGGRRNTDGHCVTERAKYTSKKGGQCAGDERDVCTERQITSSLAAIVQLQAKQYNLKMWFRKTGESNDRGKENMKIRSGSI
jgi:hypothetical protein